MLQFEWVVDKPTIVKKFLKEKGVSRRLLSRIKTRESNLYVNGKVVYANQLVAPGDSVQIILPPEGKQEIIEPIALPIDILFEDEHFVAVNKPNGYASIPSQYNPQGSMANILKAYYQQQNYENQVIHVVTRLDRDTSGIMLFAKHAFAHALIDAQLQQQQITKKYVAFTDKKIGDAIHGFIDAPIGRSPHSIIERRVVEGGKSACTEYWLKANYDKVYKYQVQLHTGRTHQIRVHFAHKEAPLIGDDLYGGNLKFSVARQALHCTQLIFKHPLTEEIIQIDAPLPFDLSQLIANNKSNKEEGKDDQ